MQHAGTMDVVEFETLHQRAVDERRMRRRQALLGAPHGAGRRGVEPAQCRAQDAAPGQSGAVERASEGIENQQLSARDHRGRDALVLQPGNETCDAAGLRIVAAGGVAHAEYRRSSSR